MPPKKTAPSYRLHKHSGHAIVTISGVDHYLGAHGAIESRERYNRLISEWYARGQQLPSRPISAAGISVGELALAFLAHADAYYRRKAVEDRKVGTIVAWRLDRLGRTAKGLTALFSELQQRRGNLVSLRDSLDLSTAAGRLMAHVLASVAQYETELRAERVRAGHATARAKGIRWGGSKPGKVIKTSATPEQIETIRRLHGEGMKIAKIARATSLSRPTVYRYLAVYRLKRVSAF